MIIVIALHSLPRLFSILPNSLSSTIVSTVLVYSSKFICLWASLHSYILLFSWLSDESICKDSCLYSTVWAARLALSVTSSISLSPPWSLRSLCGSYYSFENKNFPSMQNYPFSQILSHIIVYLLVSEKKETLIIESVDSISRDGPDIAIYVIHYKNLNNSEQLKF